MRWKAPCLVRFSNAAAYDHTFLMELGLEKGSFVVFDKVYNDYLQWTENDIYFVARQKDSAVYKSIEEFDLSDTCRIDVIPHSLIKLASGELSYITKRIDRAEDRTKIHMIDMFQVLEAFDKYRGSMERVGRAIGDYAENTLLDKLRFFELTIFSYITANNDMHLKTFR